MYDVLITISVYLLIMIINNIINIHCICNRLSFDVLIPECMPEYINVVWILYRTIFIVNQYSAEYYTILLYSLYIGIIYVIYKITQRINTKIIHYSTYAYLYIYYWRLMKSMYYLNKVLNKSKKQP